ncbi:MAG: WD40/YVTN/BNR-like repeat-containing protein [Rubrivivax sp.]
MARSKALATDPSLLHALKWRGIGPPRGGRVVAVAGDPSDPMTFYFGACAGGVWKTVDGGVYWRCVSDGFLTSATIGALAVAPSDPNVIYAGTGETTIRIDVSYGDGVYRSTDAGRSWQHLGLAETRHIGRICVHPQDPNLVYVAALGDAFGPNEARGVYRSQDGGRTWKKVLYRNADAGAVDISMDPTNPRILYAGCWNARRSFWHLNSGGTGSGLWRSMDGGDTWEELSGRGGLPGGLLGKHGVSASAARAGRVYALVEAEGEKTGMWRSDDHGTNWVQVSSHRDLMHRPWYYTHVFADPGHADTVYVTNLQMWKSTDGGVSYTEVTTPHGDNHDLWIDPRNPRRMIEGNDGGACVSFNAGATWSSIYNQKTAQFYRIDVDNQYPYRVYGTQQDNTSISVPSASEWGSITLGDCTYPGTGESGFIVVHPEDSNIVYCGAVGSSPGGAGALQRYDHRTRQIRLINVWPEKSRGVPPRELKYRFAWTCPLVFSPHDPKTLYAGGNRVFRTRDEGANWEAISPDLSLNDPSRQGHSGGPLTHDTAGAEVHATCACVVPSAHREAEIWASTDDGLVHVTRNGGGSWKNVTPKAMPALAYVGCVELSAHDADTVYVSATRYKLADYQPYLFRTTNGGRSWQSITGDLPKGEITRVVRADPVRPGLLFVGTETGIFCSLDDGAHWTRMGGGLPVAPVYDLKIKHGDLVAATHGRSFWILDDLSALRQLREDARAVQLVTPRETVRTKLTWSAGSGYGKAGISYGPAFGISGGSEPVTAADGSTRRQFLDVGEGAPTGALLWWWLPAGFSGAVRLTVLDAKGQVVRTLASDDPALANGRRPGTRAGLNRYVWDLRHTGPTRQDPALSDRRNTPLADDKEELNGPLVAPGRYTLVLEAGRERLEAPLVVVKDPRVKTSQRAFEQQLALLRQLHEKWSALNDGVNRLRRLRGQLRALQPRLQGAAHQAVAAQARALVQRLDAIESVMVDPLRESVRDVLRHQAGLDDQLADLVSVVAIADEAPTTPALEVSREAMAHVDEQLGQLQACCGPDLAALNAALRASGVEVVAAAA